LRKHKSPNSTCSVLLGTSINHQRGTTLVCDLVAQLALVRARLNRILRQWYRLAPRQQLIIRHWIRSETIFTASSRSACTIPDSLSGLPLLLIFSQRFLI